jgi:hypothetical protein
MVTREDVLKEKFSLDNSPFLGELEKMGFYVADCSQSNYGFTNFSLASSLHMDYMDKISERYLEGKMDLMWLPELLRKNEVRQNLVQLGYTVVAFQNDYYQPSLGRCGYRYSKEFQRDKYGAALPRRQWL